MILSKNRSILLVLLMGIFISGSMDIKVKGVIIVNVIRNPSFEEFPLGRYWERRWDSFSPWAYAHTGKRALEFTNDNDRWWQQNISIKQPWINLSFWTSCSPAGLAYGMIRLNYTDSTSYEFNWYAPEVSNNGTDHKFVFIDFSTDIPLSVRNKSVDYFRIARPNRSYTQNFYVDDVYAYADPPAPQSPEELSESSEKEKTIQELERKIEKLENKTNQLKDRVRELEDRIKHLEEKGAKEKKIKKLESKIKKLEWKINQIKLKIKRLEERINRLKDEKNDLEETVKENETKSSRNEKKFIGFKKIKRWLKWFYSVITGENNGSRENRTNQRIISKI